MVGLLLYIFSTIPYFPHITLVVPFIYALIYRRNEFVMVSKSNKKMYQQLSVYTVIMLALFLLGSMSRPIEFPYFLPILITFFIAAVLDSKDIKVIIYCLVIESIIGFAEYSLGVQTILPGIIDENAFLDGELLYFRRIMGLSGSSSVFAVHLLIGLLFLFKERQNIKYYIIISLIMVSSLLLTFNRTVMLAAVPFELFMILEYVNNGIKSKTIKNLIKVSLCVAVAYTIYSFYDLIEYQFTRGGNDNVMTGRPLIWNNYKKYILDNLVFGNFGHRTLLLYDGVPNHAHNSFIQLLANVGLPMFIFYISIILNRVKKSNWIYIIPLFFVSMAQYEIFWGISLADIALFSFICNKTNNRQSSTI